MRRSRFCGRSTRRRSSGPAARRRRRSRSRSRSIPTRRWLPRQRERRPGQACGGKPSRVRLAFSRHRRRNSALKYPDGEASAVRACRPNVLTERWLAVWRCRWSSSTSPPDVRERNACRSREPSRPADEGAEEKGAARSEAETAMDARILAPAHTRHFVGRHSNDQEKWPRVRQKPRRRRSATRSVIWEEARRRRRRPPYLVSRRRRERPGR